MRGPFFCFCCLIAGTNMSMEGQLPTPAHHEGASEASKLNMIDEVHSMRQSMEVMMRQLQSLTKDVGDLKKGKGSTTAEQRVGENLGGAFTPHSQPSYGNFSPYGPYDAPAHSTFHDGGRDATKGGKRGGKGRRGLNRPHEEFQRDKAWHDDNLADDYGGNPYVGQEHFGDFHGGPREQRALDKIKWKVPSFQGESAPNVFLDWECKVEISSKCETIVRLSKLSWPVPSFPVMHFIGRIKLQLKEQGFELIWCKNGPN